MAMDHTDGTGWQWVWVIDRAITWGDCPAGVAGPYHVQSVYPSRRAAMGDAWATETVSWSRLPQVRERYALLAFPPSHRRLGGGEEYLTGAEYLIGLYHAQRVSPTRRKR